MRIEHEFNCLGYFGFGTGISTIRKEGAYCNGCPQNKACWEIHKDRCRKYFPDLVAHLDSMDLKTRVKYADKGKSDPYISIMMGNIEDAMNILSNGNPKDRGPYTINYPFKDHA